MPRIPTYTPQQQTSGPTLRDPNMQPVPAETAGERQLGKTLGRITDMVREREVQEDVTQTNRRLAEIQVEISRDLQETTQSAERGQDIVEPFVERTRERFDSLEDEVQTAEGRKLIARQRARLQQHYVKKAIGEQGRLKAAWAEEDYHESVNQWVGAIQNNPDALDVTLDIHDAAVEALVQSHGLDAKRAAELRTQGRKSLTRASIRGAIRQDPERAFERLNENAVANIDPEEQQQWIESAGKEMERQQRAEVAAKERQRKAEERAQEQLESETFKSGMEALATNNLTMDWVFENRDNLDETDYKFFLQELSGDQATETDPDVYADLRVRAGAGVDVTRDARRALKNNLITVADFNNIINEVESSSSRGQMPSTYKQGKDYIRRQIGGENANPMELQVQGRVMDHWTEWMRNNPHAGHSEAMEVARRYASEGLIIQGQQQVGLPVPTYMPGGRRNPDPWAGIERLDEAFEDGEIDEFEYDRQTQLMLQWADAIKAQERAQEERQSARSN